MLKGKQTKWNTLRPGAPIEVVREGLWDSVTLMPRAKVWEGTHGGKKGWTELREQNRQTQPWVKEGVHVLGRLRDRGRRQKQELSSRALEAMAKCLHVILSGDWGSHSRILSKGWHGCQWADTAAHRQWELNFAALWRGFQNLLHICKMWRALD